MNILALDTSLNACSVALVEAGQVRASVIQPMQRGHQEQLAPMVASVLDEAGIRPTALDRIAVTLGPGSFTGLRVGLSYAKGFALGLGVPLVGFNTLACLTAMLDAKGAVLAVIDARREQLYAQLFEGQRPVADPFALSLGDLAALTALPEVDAVVGPGADRLQARFPDARIETPELLDPVALARLAALANPELARPDPVYIREPDAKLPGGLSLADL